MGSHSSLQGLFLTQRSNAGLPHCGRILYQLSHQGSPTRMGHPVEKRNISSQRLLQALVPHLLGPPSHPVMREPTPHDGKQSEGDLVPGPGAPRPEVCCLWPSPGPKGPVPQGSLTLWDPLPLLWLESLVHTIPVFHLNNSGVSCLLVAMRVMSLSTTLLQPKSGPGTHQLRLARCNPETPLWLISSRTPAPAPPRPPLLPLTILPLTSL